MTAFLITLAAFVIVQGGMFAVLRASFADYRNDNRMVTS